MNFSNNNNAIAKIADGLKILCGLIKQVGTTLKKHQLNQRRLPKDRYWPQRYNTCRANQLSQYKYKLY